MVAETNHEMAAVYQADETPPSIGDVMAAAKKATGASKVRLDVAVDENFGRRASSEPAHRRRLARSHGTRSNKQSQPGQLSRYGLSSRFEDFVTRTHPEVAQQWQTGRVSELAMRTIFRQWFKD